MPLPAICPCCGFGYTAGMTETSKSRRRWFNVTPDRVLLALLPLWGMLFLSEHFHWLSKEYSVLLAVASMPVVVVFIVPWFATALLLRWRFQYSLRTLLLVMLVASIGMSWFAVKMQRARKQKEAVEAIEKLDGSVAYDWEIGISSEPPACLQNVFGEDFFATVGGVFFPYDGTLSDADLELLEGLTELKGLFFGGTDPLIMGGGVPPHRLEFRRKQVTDAGLEHLKGLTKLEVLDLAKVEITDAGLEHLKGLTQLQALFLNQTQVTDAGLEHLKGLTQLQELGLRNTKVTDDGINKLQRALPNCKIIH